jgi:hypothetical protein
MTDSCIFQKLSAEVQHNVLEDSVNAFDGMNEFKVASINELLGTNLCGLPPSERSLAIRTSKNTEKILDVLNQQSWADAKKRYEKTSSTTSTTSIFSKLTPEVQENVLFYAARALCTDISLFTVVERTYGLSTRYTPITILPSKLRQSENVDDILNYINHQTWVDAKKDINTDSKPDVDESIEARKTLLESVNRLIIEAVTTDIIKKTQSNIFRKLTPEVQQYVLLESIRKLRSFGVMDKLTREYVFELLGTTLHGMSEIIILAHIRELGNYEEILDLIDDRSWVDAKKIIEISHAKKHIKNNIKKTTSTVDGSIEGRNTVLVNVNRLIVKVAFESTKYEINCVLAGIVEVPINLIGNRNIPYHVADYAQRASLETLRMMEVALVELHELQKSKN